MKKLLIIFIFISTLYSSDTIGIDKKQKDQNTTVYSIQLFAYKSLQGAKIKFDTIPQNLKDKVALYKSGEYIVARYGAESSYEKMEKSLQKIKEAGYTDAFVAKTNSFSMKNNRIVTGDKTKKEITQNEKITPIISKHNESELLLKAQEAYQSGDEMSALFHFEMLLDLGYENQKIKNNLCYLYGKRGAWLQAQKLIESEGYEGKLIYAYAYGAVESNQDNYYDTIFPYIAADNSGRLIVLSGYYFEKRGDMQKALSFYKMAYKKNPSDIYNIYAYARALDIEQNKKAKSLYLEALKKIDASHQLYAIIKKRFNELGG